VVNWGFHGGRFTGSGRKRRGGGISWSSTKKTEMKRENSKPGESWPSKGELTAWGKPARCQKGGGKSKLNKVKEATGFGNDGKVKQGAQLGHKKRRDLSRKRKKGKKI